MLSFAYNKSSSITQLLNTLDELRKDILVTPLNQKDHIQLKWDMMLQRIRYSELLEGRSFTVKAISTALTPFGRTKPKLNERKIIQYKQAWNYITQNWSMNQNAVTGEHISDLYNMLGYPQIIPDIEALNKSLKYLQANNEHPVIQSALAHITIATAYSNKQDLATLVSYLFLYKQGYDVKGYIILEDYFFQTKEKYDRLIMNSSRSANGNLFIEYIGQGIEKNMNLILAKLNEPKNILNPITPKVEINRRQKEILSLFDYPDVHITNRDIQKKFSISQITASRDLAKLNVLGLVFAHGKGRSVYYTKV